MVYFLYLYTHSFKSCFELKMTIEKANRVSCFFRYCPIILLYIFLLNSSISPKFSWITKYVLLSHDLFCVSLRPLIQKLFRVQKHHQEGNRILPAPHLTITLTSRVTSTINSQSPVVRPHRLIELHGTDKFGGTTVAHKRSIP